MTRSGRALVTGALLTLGVGSLGLAPRPAAADHHRSRVSIYLNDGGYYRDRYCEPSYEVVRVRRYYSDRDYYDNGRYRVRYGRYRHRDCDDD